LQILIKQIKNNIDSLNLNAISLIMGHEIRVLVSPTPLVQNPISEGQKLVSVRN